MRVVAQMSWAQLMARLALAGCGVLGLFASVARAGPPSYERKGNWAKTMLALRAQYIEWREQAVLVPGPWHVTPGFKARKFSQVLAPEREVDLKAKGEDGKMLWTVRGDYVDGEVHQFSAPDSSSTYLYRSIQSGGKQTAIASFGSDDGLSVWLNGESVLSKDVARVAAANQDEVKLKLRKDGNDLLVKIYNRTGESGFYCAITPDSAQAYWGSVQQDFPIETQWLSRDVGDGAVLTWFNDASHVDLETAALGKAIAALGDGGATLKRDFEALCAANAAPEDPRWWKLYGKAAVTRERLRTAERQLGLVDFVALRRAIDDLSASFPSEYTKGAKFLRRLEACEAELPGVLEALASGDVRALNAADEIVEVQRTILLSNPLLDFDEVMLVKRGVKNMGLPANWQGNCAMPSAGYDNEIAVLSSIGRENRMATLFKPARRAFVGDVDLHFDADRILFSMPGSYGRWQIWELPLGDRSAEPRQVTPGDHPDVDNYDACYLPDGRIIFDSTRAFQGVPCVGGSNTVANLCIMDADGGNIRQLCFDQDHDWCPTVLNNGRILYTRWEYSDTPHYFTRLLFHMNPDGTNQAEYYGSNSYWPNSTFYARPIPGHPTQVVAIVSGHHGVARMGELIIFDPAKGRHEADGVVQRIPGYGKKVEPIIADQLVNNSWPRFLHPYPLSGKYFLVSCRPTPDHEWGVYLVDIFDNMLLLYEEPGYAMLEPIPLRETPTPPAIPDKVRLDESEGTVYLADVYRGEGLRGVPRGTVKSLRVYEFHYAYPQMGGHINVGVEGAWDVHRILGTVPVYEDGSASFTVPANTPLAIQPLDAESKAVQLMRSWFVAMPGEVLSCVGCHERQNETVSTAPTIAARKKPAEITPWYGPTRGFSFKRDLQPVLNRYCVGCHDGGKTRDGRHKPDLREKKKDGWGRFTPAYLELHPYVRRPGPESDYHILTPLEFHADTSELIQMLQKGHHGVQLDEEAMDRLVTWIDLNVPDHGTWGEHRPIPEDFHQRRLDMRTRYANRPEDPELIPELPPRDNKFVRPKRVSIPKGARPAAPKVRKPKGDLPATRSLELADGVTLDLVLVPAGEYVMGARDGYIDEAPMTRVTIDEPFYMGRLEVTAAQYAHFDPDHDNGFLDQRHKDHTTPGYPANAPANPVIRVSWDEAMAFCDWLSKKAGTSVVLPTEAQWEWACRAGTSSPFSYGDLDTDFSPYANLADITIKRLAVTGINPSPIANPNPYQDYLPKEARFDDGSRLMSEAGRYQANPWGLYDMHGNVCEWTMTAYRAYPYQGDDGRNDPATGEKRVVRGGSWRDRPKRARSAFRLAYLPWQKVFNVGFRVVCPVQ
ncbi:MAG: SUMF1/EgtB/PvdO family nonheme iron enzyme [Nitrospiraceae bacterium]|nr:SUMF1/EgtB/PvdO family nonheme iron enzyme [Nitrospiraceae bacterium]